MLEGPNNFNLESRSVLPYINNSTNNNFNKVSSLGADEDDKPLDI